MSINLKNLTKINIDVDKIISILKYNQNLTPIKSMIYQSITVYYDNILKPIYFLEDGIIREESQKIFSFSRMKIDNVYKTVIVIHGCYDILNEEIYNEIEEIVNNLFHRSMQNSVDFLINSLLNECPET